jgi:RNA polymerase sigma-70 factor, ECF subfamily
VAYLRTLTGDTVLTADDHSGDLETLEKLALHAAEGDRAALESLMVVIRPRVLRHCRRLLPYSDDAEDACQDTLVRVTQRIGTFEGRSQFTTWLYHVTANSARDTYRRLSNAAPVNPVTSDQTMQEQPDPRTTSVIAGSRLDVLEALDRLEQEHPALVAPFVLRDLYDLSYTQIAAHLDTPLGTVKRQIHDARAWMRKAF